MTPPPVLGFTFICIAITVLLIALGMVLRRKGVLNSRGKKIGWTFLVLVPLLVSIAHSLTMPATEDVPRAGSEDAVPPPTADLGKEK